VNAPKERAEAPENTILLFDSTHDAMQAEEAIIDAGFWCEIVPRPADSRSTLCGLAVAIQTADTADISRLLEGAGIRFQVYRPAKA
jgi:hypothetical protein